MVALGLGVQRNERDLSIFEMRDKFMEMACEAFRNSREGSLVAALDPAAVISKAIVVFGLFKSVYPTRHLRKCLQHLFGEEMTLFGPSPPTKHRSVRVAVTSVRASSRTLCLITNYNRHVTGGKMRDHSQVLDQDEHDDEENEEVSESEAMKTKDRRVTFGPEDQRGEHGEERQWEGIEREDQLAKELKVWEAGLAAAAAPFYFKPFSKQETKKDYLDGGLLANFPGEQALHEMSLVWATSDSREPHLDIMVSVGTGTQPKDVRLPLAGGGLDTMFKAYIDNLDSSRAWDEFRKKPDYHRHYDRIFRLNSTLPPGSNIPLNDYRKMETISAHVEAQGQSDLVLVQAIEDTAARLLASLFFFEPTDMRSPISSVQHGMITRATCAGSIRCRLAHRSPEMLGLIGKIDKFWLGTVSSGNNGQ